MVDEGKERIEFDFEAVFEVEDYMFFYAETLTDEVSARQVAALVELLELGQPVKILDLACGFGRHANRLAALGHQVSGIDLTEGFLEIARRDAQECGVQVEYRLGDMRDLDERQVYDCIMLLFTSFGYFSDDENQLVVQNAARALKPGGLFIFDVPNRDMMMKSFLPYIVTDKDGDLMIDRIRFDSLSGRMANRRIVIRDGVRKDKPFSIRVYNPSEIKTLLQEAGLEWYKAYGGYEGEPISTESRRMVIIGRK